MTESKPVRIFTCWSCAAFRPSGCVHRISGWPHLRLQDCRRAEYEPGSDEAEKHAEQDAQIPLRSSRTTQEAFTDAVVGQGSGEVFAKAHRVIEDVEGEA